jgi:hypothetical protein
MRARLAVLTAFAAASAALSVPSHAAPPTAESAASCAQLSRGLVEHTKVYTETPVGFRRFVEPWDPLCHDFTGDGRRDVAFAILSGGTGGAFKFAVFRRTSRVGGSLARRYVKLAERGHGSKTSLRRSGRRLKVLNPIYRPGDGNCCPSGGTWVRTYRFTRTEAILVNREKVRPQ